MLDFFGMENVAFFCDNNESLHGKERYGIRIISLEELKELHQNYLIIISAGTPATRQIKDILDCLEIRNYIPCSMILGNADLMDCSTDEIISNLKYGLKSGLLQRQCQFLEKQIEMLTNQNIWLKRHVDVSSLKPAKGYLRKCQLEVIEFCREVFSVISELGIHPILAGGNLLGYVRHNGFIPWDDDIDFFLMRHEYEKLMEFCKREMVVCVQSGKSEDYCSWMTEMIEKYPNQYILNMNHAHIQITKGSTIIDRKGVDFFSLDCYQEGYPYAEHKRYLRKMEAELKKIEQEEDKIRYIEESRKEYPYIVEKSKNLFYGIDNGGHVYCLSNDWNRWFVWDEIFPLIKIEFEGLSVWSPRKPEQILTCKYGKYMDLPMDCGISMHDYWTGYKQTALKNVEFYLVDSFEIDHFEPLYKQLRLMGINAVFVAEPPEINISGKYFDFERAIEILDDKCLEYHTKCNPTADFACTTQRVGCLNKYQKKTARVHLTYGVSLLKNIFCVSMNSIKGFKYKLVHGDFDQRLCRELDDKIEVKIVGYPRFWNIKSKHIDKFKLRKDLNIHTDKKILCYLPTWDEYSSIANFSKNISRLREEYYIVTRPHHCTWRLLEKKRDLEMLYAVSDMVLPPKYDFLSFSYLGDVAIVDARSGASMDVAFLNPQLPILLISAYGDLQSIFHKEIFSMFSVIDDSKNLDCAFMKKICTDDQHLHYRQKNMHRFYREVEDKEEVLEFFLTGI